MIIYDTLLAIDGLLTKNNGERMNASTVAELTKLYQNIRSELYTLSVVAHPELQVCGPYDATGTYVGYDLMRQNMRGRSPLMGYQYKHDSLAQALHSAAHLLGYAAPAAADENPSAK